MNNQVAILLLSCPDRIGLVSRISHFVFERGGNILDLDEHVDTSEKYFFVRIAWDMKNFSISESEMMEAFTPLAKEFKAKWRINFSGKNLRAAVFVSKFDHCLQEILWRQRLGEFNIEIPLIISNHNDLKPLAEHYGIPYYFYPVTPENKTEQEKKELALLKENQIDVIVLARYMQILSGQFVDEYPNGIINIHHSFLPAFSGNDPYRQAYDRGVKIIGATSHYVTKELDDGPIIEQDIIRITHKDTVNDLIRKGRDLERLILARALYYHSQHRVLIHGRKTIIFD
ncbi:MAG: formyltetrahydrofolate deformylase [Ignavibacteria bacterium GWA2_35_9]|nr:MAG: formyltetrahydrofolate deformylase [Ignavibacteria bacterium GWA2_35_9]OGU52979.1 MAG: formyltetrahydrofolate deformylase [Ignavibacteria bacterium GWC2_36_12]